MQVSPEHIIILTLVFILCGGFLVLYVALYNQRKSKLIRERRELAKQFEDELAKSRMEVQEQTLKTIAAEIHDNVGQLLSLSKLTLSTVDMATDPAKSKLKIESALSLLDSSIKELRQLTSLFYADNLLSGGLEVAIQNELHRLARTERFTVDWQCSGTATSEIDGQRALLAFRIFQELLNNIVKHAEATVITVQFAYVCDALTIQMRDDGKGFDVGNVSQQPVGLGITTLYKRAAMMGGTLELTSEIGVGTSAKVTIPY